MTYSSIELTIMVNVSWLLGITHGVVFFQILGRGEGDWMLPQHILQDGKYLATNDNSSHFGKYIDGCSDRIAAILHVGNMTFTKTIKGHSNSCILNRTNLALTTANLLGLSFDDRDLNYMSKSPSSAPGSNPSASLEPSMNPSLNLSITLEPIAQP